MSARAADRLRWTLVLASVVVWFAALALNVGGNAIHLLLLVAIGLLVYELLIDEPA
ncbi:MAG: DUF5670 family protein [Chloroflexota bacterium]|nr:DUF5670 family protein [Chloroflexota bacterium]